MCISMTSRGKPPEGTPAMTRSKVVDAPGATSTQESMVPPERSSVALPVMSMSRATVATLLPWSARAVSGMANLPLLQFRPASNTATETIPTITEAESHPLISPSLRSVSSESS